MLFKIIEKGEEKRWRGFRFGRHFSGGREEVIFSPLSAGCSVAAKQWQICGIGIVVSHRFISKSKWNLKIGME